MTEPFKRITLDIEWRGACSETDWGAVLTELIESHDASKTTRVVHVRKRTNYGTTDGLPRKQRSSFRLPHFIERWVLRLPRSQTNCPQCGYES